jgi:DNA-binding XRE family transcriptional regulator
MDKKEFSKIRAHLGKAQKQMAQLLGVSLKAIQSFEEGWRKIPVHNERQTFFLLALKKDILSDDSPCWSIKKCPQEIREKCPAWEFNAGQICWFINGTFCQGQAQISWKKKMQMCRKCGIFKTVLSSIGPQRR